MTRAAGPRSRRFYALVASDHGLDLDYVYSTEPEPMRPAATARVEAMDLWDAWVAAGCALEDPLLAAERRALVTSCTALRAAVGS